MFYIYLHNRLDDNSTFYVGKGCGNRAYNINGRSDEWQKIYNEAGGRIVNIVFECADEEVVFAYEKFLIKTGNIWGDLLVNKTHGGEGRSGKILSEETKEKLRKANTGKKHSDLTKNKLKIRSSNPEWKIAHSKATKLGMIGSELKHKEKQKSQYKPVVGTNLITNEELPLDFMSQDKRFDPSLIKKCCQGKRKSHAGYRWRLC